jgi:hypothetical protein
MATSIGISSTDSPAQVRDISPASQTFESQLKAVMDSSEARRGGPKWSDLFSGLKEILTNDIKSDHK